MAQVENIEQLQDTEIEVNGVIKIGANLTFTIEHGEEKPRFVQNVYLPKDNIEEEAQKYVDDYEKEYNEEQPAAAVEDEEEKSSEN